MGRAPWVFVYGSLLLSSGWAADAAEPLVRFSERLIADKYGYTFGVAAYDLDGDGDLDLTNVDIVGKNPSDASLIWFENDGRGGFQRHLIHQKENGWLERHAIGDLNGDGRPDVAVVSNRDGLLLWFAHPGAAVRGFWQRHVITTNFPHAYDLALADFDGDGDLDAAAAGYVSNTLAWFENPGPAGGSDGEQDAGKGGASREWRKHLIDASLIENRTVRLGDFNRDGRVDLVAASVGVSMTVAGESATPEQHGASVVWFENPGRSPDAQWKKRVIDNQSRAPIHGQAIDLDRDGDLDVVMAFGMRPEHVPESHHQIAWYENLGRPGDATAWKRHVVGPLPCAFEAVAVDIDGDGDIDLAATAWSKGDRVVWFENGGDPRGEWRMHLIKEKYLAANQVIAADIDGDGRSDIVATADDGSRRVQGANELRWWRNEGRR
jgi:hypothetical protein